jgi:tetratricopeptide (TPR) repeat protein
MSRPACESCAVCPLLILPFLLSTLPTPTSAQQLPGTVGARSMIEGRVITQSNEPLRGVTVVLVDFNGADRRTAFTDDTGAFVFASLRPGNYQIQATLAGFEPQSVRVDHDGERDFSMRIVLRPRADGSQVTVTTSTAVWALRIPSSAQAAYDRGIAELQRKRAKQAQEHFAKAVALYPEYASAHAALGSLALAAKDGKAAQAAFVRAVEIDSNLVDAQLGLASIALGAKKYDDARTYLLKARGLKPDDWRILHQLGETEWQLGLFEEAEPNLRRAIELNASSERTHLLLINVLALQEKLPETLRAMDVFLKLFPRSPFAPQVREKRAALKKQIGVAPLQPPGWAMRG